MNAPPPPSALHPRSLRTRLVVGVLGLVLVMAAAMGALSTLTLRHTLMNRLDDQLTAASHRADVRRHGTKHDESALNDDARRSAEDAEDAEDAANGEKREEPADPSSAGPTAAPSSASSGQPPGACETRGPDGAKPVPAGLDAAGQPTGTLTLIASGARDDQNDGGADLASSTVTAGYIDDDGRYQEQTRAECEALLSLEANGRPVTVDIGSLGSYRVLAAKDAETGDIVITGLSMKVDNALVRTQLLIEGAIAVAGTLVVALAGRVMVRSSLAPLARVACTAERVASQPLARSASTSGCPRRIWDPPWRSARSVLRSTPCSAMSTRP